MPVHKCTYKVAWIMRSNNSNAYGLIQASNRSSAFGLNMRVRQKAYELTTKLAADGLAATRECQQRHMLCSRI